ncbi:MAG: polymer-forming cytoskeletal protein [Lachnospiraceae bacterium]|nr:polymer-forming cytoskeletal protein [Lachnospiraceae bacterium]
MAKRKKELPITTIVGVGSEIQGDFSVKGSARIDGIVDGNVTVEGKLILGAGAAINGEVIADSALIGGEVMGNIEAPGKTELTATAKVYGDIVTAVIVIDERAVFQGKCDMIQQEPDRQDRKNVEKAIRYQRRSAKAAVTGALKDMEQIQEKTIVSNPVKYEEQEEAIEENDQMLGEALQTEEAETAETAEETLQAEEAETAETAEEALQAEEVETAENVEEAMQVEENETVAENMEAEETEAVEETVEAENSEAAEETKAAEEIPQTDLQQATQRKGNRKNRRKK